MYQLALIFRGAGNVYARELPLYHPDVDIYFQKKAWCDRPFAVSWYVRTMKPWLAANYEEHPWALYLDSLDAQRAFDFVSGVQADHGEVIFGPRGKTDGWQPIDVGGLGSIFKALFRVEQELWMDLTFTTEDGLHVLPNWRRWESSLTARDKRVLTSWWAGQAYEKFIGEKYDHARENSFQRGGCTAGTEGFDSNVVQVQGLHRPFGRTAPDQPFDDQVYLNDSYSGSIAINYSDQLPGGDDVMGYDSDEGEDPKVNAKTNNMNM
jgi:hypothetical protein